MTGSAYWGAICTESLMMGAINTVPFEEFTLEEVVAVVVPVVVGVPDLELILFALVLVLEVFKSETIVITVWGIAMGSTEIFVALVVFIISTVLLVFVLIVVFVVFVVIFI